MSHNKDSCEVIANENSLFETALKELPASQGQCCGFVLQSWRCSVVIHKPHQPSSLPLIEVKVTSWQSVSTTW